MAKKKWGMFGKPKKEVPKVSKTMAEVGQKYKKAANLTNVMKVTQVGLPLKPPSVVKAVTEAAGKGVGGMSARKKGWKKPGKRGIMGL